MKFLTCCAMLLFANAAWGQIDSDITSVDDVFKDVRASALEAADEPDEEPRAGWKANLLDNDIFNKSDDDESREAITAAIAPTRSTRRAVAEENDIQDAEYLGRISANPLATDSTSNQFSQAGSPYSPKSINNPYGQYGSEYSPQSARNPYATDAPKIYAEDGTYLGRLSENRFDPESTANPYGRYGSPYSPTSINNPYS
ncbi:MAG: hypothetical protein ACOYOL_12705, partial [Chthoniobacterales bacterium]